MRISSRKLWSTGRFGVSALLVILLAEAFHTQNLETENIRIKRQVSCATKYRVIITGHSACLAQSSEVKAQGVEDDDKQTIVDIHNKVRREVSPTATNMMIMSWDDAVANIAQRWASNCRFQHDEYYKRYDFGRFYLGQSITMSPLKIDWSRAIQAWSDEKAYYSYSSNTPQPAEKVVGHYTQMVWANSAKIGCGYAQCDSFHLYVCNYGPGGNYPGQRPYESGNTCSSCPGNCNNGLCDCKGLVCLNEGVIDLNKCTCKCRDLPFYLSPNCRLDCTDVKDSSHCNYYETTGCEYYTNVPQECPVMCKWCPYTAYNTTDVVGGTNLVSSSVFTLVAMVLIHRFCYL